MSASVASLRKLIPSLRKREPSEDVPVETVGEDVKREKSASDSEDEASKEVTTAVDPDLNPGTLSFEEGA